MSPTETARAFTLTTPSLGVQQWRDDGSDRTTRIAWASVGGRGLASTLIVLPVVPVEGPGGRVRWVPPESVMKALAANPRAFWDQTAGDPLRMLRRKLPHDRVAVGVDDRDDDPAAPRATSMADDCGARWGAHHLVVLLRYDEAPGVGDPGDGGGAFANESGDDDDRVYGQEAVAIKTFFGKYYDPRLVTRGLVRLPSGRRPENREEIVVALASCQYPADMTDGAPSDHRGPEAPSSASMLRLSRLLIPMTSSSPSLLLLAGDQVYVDATAGLFDARSKTDRLRLPYQNLLDSPGAQSIFGLLPVAMMLDDHEIVDNWGPGIDVPGADPRRPRSIDDSVAAYRRFQRMAGPPLERDALWCTFTHAGVPFFLADTRTERKTPDGEPRTVKNWRKARIMSDAQWKALRDFLTHNRDRVCFVVSPSILLPRALDLARRPSRALEADNWDGFPASREALLALLCDGSMRRTVFLSGDAHTSVVAEATVRREDGHRTRLWSVHSSGLYCPYPFANGSQDDYAAEETFIFAHGEHEYTCTVKCLTWAPGDGFATLRLTRSYRAGLTLAVRYHRAGRDVAVPAISL
jgi:hypothetical protein